MKEKPSFISYYPQDLSVTDIHHYLLGAIAPRPIALVSTIDIAGKVNLSPFSFFNVFSSNPPILIFSPARRGRDNTTKHTYDNVQEVPEAVVHIVNHTIVEQTSLSSTEYEKGVNEFIKSGFTQLESKVVKPPRVAESPVAFECKIREIVSLGDHGGAGQLVIAEVLCIHIQSEYLDNEEKLKLSELDQVGRMGGNFYSRSNEGLFIIPKPLQSKGIGIDQLPKHVRGSRILTGNDLARLGNLEQLPIKTGRSILVSEIDKTHTIAKELISEHREDEALELLVRIRDEEE